MKYGKGGPHHYTQKEASKLAKRLPAADVLICHCPPLGINDDPDDPAHVGFAGLRDWVERHRAAPHPARPHPPGRRARDDPLRLHPRALDQRRARDHAALAPISPSPAPRTPRRVAETTTGGGMTGEPAFFEIGVEDPERGRAFYGALFGWELDVDGRGPSDRYRGDSGRAPRRRQGRGPLAVLSRRRHGRGTGAPARARRQRRGHARGRGETAESIARYGRFKWCRDDQGSAFGLHQPPA